MDIVKMMWALIVQGNHRFLDVVEMGFWLAVERYINGNEVDITRKTIVEE
jgi:hypothetical protein